MAMASRNDWTLAIEQLGRGGAAALHVGS